MARSRNLVTVSALALILALGSTAAAGPAVTRKPVANAAKMDRGAFESLSDDDVVDVKGKAMTKREVMVQVKSLREAKAQASEQQQQDALEDERASLAQKQKATLDSENAPVLAKMSDLKKSAAASRSTGDRPATLAAPSGLMAAAPASPQAASSATPKLTGMLGQLKPGAAVILFGSGFGALEGEVRLYGTFPNGFIKLPIDSWGNGGIGIFVPTTVTGIFDQQMTLKVVTKTGIASNYKTAPFTAAREIRKLKMSDFATKQCRDAALSSDTCTTVGQSSCSSSVCGSHVVPVLGAAASTDRFAATLKNGWTYDHHGFDGAVAFSPGPQEWINPVILLETYLLGNEKPTIKTLSTGGAPSFEIPWRVPSLWADTYKLNVYVTGPAGTPHV